MLCPKCETTLNRSRYHGANVRYCSACHGMLLDRIRAQRLEKRVNKDVEQLITEAETTGTPDTLEKIRCPSCRYPMTKNLVEELCFHIDDCSNCDKVWFDGGELTQQQLAFECDEQTVELNQMRQRLRNMTQQERAEYDERIANLRAGTQGGEVVYGAAAELLLWYLCYRR